MNLSWANLRTLSGSQQAAFEELCRQLARSETPVDDRFVPKGSPDAGVECLYTLPNGDEWGWQAKFFESSLTSAQWNQLDRSVKKALDSHPKLARYFVCVPRNRADGRRSGIKTELQRWDERVEKWSGWAFDLGMEVKFNWWGSSELWERLSLQEQAGKRAFWFGNPELYTNRWFRNRLDEAVASAGARYSPELHVDLPIAQSFELFGRTSAAATSVHRLAKDIRGACSYEIRRIATEESLDRLTSLKPVVDTCNEIAGACDEIVGALADGQCPPHQQWNIADICEAIKTALGLIDSSQEAVASAPRDYEESNPKGETGHARSSNPFRSAASALRYLESQLWATLSELRAIEPIINSDLLIVTGEAGTGKTHLLCDVAENRIGQGLPTVILMGQRFLSAEAPWGQALAQLDLANSSADEFIGALEAAAQAADSRALFIIDAINEGEGDVIWPAHLSPLLEQLRRSPWIATVLSVRTPYLERVVPAEVFQSAHVLEHHGFAESTYAAVRRYCEQFDLEFPTTPLLRPEFDNPLFLKTMCEGLRSTGQRRFPVGSEGITRIFDRYLDGINTRLADQLDLDPQARTVHRALEILVKRFSERRARWLPRNEAQSLVDELAPNRAYSRSLYRALVDSGVLMEVLPSSLEGNPVVQFGFEWFADHLIAVGLIDSHEDTESLARELAPWDAPGIATRRPLMSGLLDALAILLPERHRAELPDVYTGDLAAWSAMQSFLKTLPWRDPNTIGPRCHALVDDAFDSLNGEHEWPLLIDSLVTCATIPKHPVGAESFDDRLRQLPMPDRDAVWSTYLHYAYDEDGPVDRLLDWAESLHPTDANIDPESARACAVVLAWFLTASNRFVRDRATKCLVALLHENCDLATELVRRFHDVDDPYVVERVIAAAYGIAMRSADAQGLGSLATVVYENVFAASNPPVHFLTRDYARGVIERALYLGSPIDIDRSKIEPPYPSAWPDIPDDAELERIDPRETGTTGTEYARSLIRTSVMHWDFSRYIIGTNSTDVSHTWLSVPLDEPRWKSCDEQLEDFLTWLGDDLGETFRSLIKRNPRSMRSALLARGQARTSQEETEEIISAFVFKPLVADTGFYQICLKMLKDEQRRRYHE
ncbi:MAG: NACHT domain-containing protein, partial [Acidimicrobiaceae bacterium]|nr:NACHT domain-containing protein [Acidimicrobiaceae bacterium]